MNRGAWRASIHRVTESCKLLTLSLFFSLTKDSSTKSHKVGDVTFNTRNRLWIWLYPRVIGIFHFSACFFLCIKFIFGEYPLIPIPNGARWPPEALVLLSTSYMTQRNWKKCGALFMVVSSKSQGSPWLDSSVSCAHNWANHCGWGMAWWSADWLGLPDYSWSSARAFEMNIHFEMNKQQPWIPISHLLDPWRLQMAAFR